MTTAPQNQTEEGAELPSKVHGAAALLELANIAGRLIVGMPASLAGTPLHLHYLRTFAGASTDRIATLNGSAIAHLEAVTAGSLVGVRQSRVLWLFQLLRERRILTKVVLARSQILLNPVESTLVDEKADLCAAENIIDTLTEVAEGGEPKE